MEAGLLFKAKSPVNLSPVDHLKHESGFPIKIRLTTGSPIPLNTLTAQKQFPLSTQRHVTGSQTALRDCSHAVNSVQDRVARVILVVRVDTDTCLVCNNAHEL